MKHIRLIITIVSCLIFMGIRSQDSPVTMINAITNAFPGTTNVPLEIVVNDFIEIGQFMLTIEFDTTRVRYNGSTTHPFLNGMQVTYTPPAGNNNGTLQLAWSAAGTINQSLTDGTAIATLDLDYITGTGLLSWKYTFGAICRYRRNMNGSLVTLNDNPKYAYYINGGISNRGAPITYAPSFVNQSPGTLSVPITVENFTNISALTLYLEYDPLYLTYQGTFTKNAAFLSSFLVGDQAGTAGKRRIAIQWYGSAVNLANGSILCELNFTYSTTHGTHTSLEWFENGPSCEYADGNGDILLDFPASTYYINGGFKNPRINIIIEPGIYCGELIVKLQPLEPIQGDLSKLIFTIEWPAGSGADVMLTEAESIWPDLKMRGERTLSGGYYYQSFSTTTSWPVQWAANSENIALRCYHNGMGQDSSDFIIIATDYGTSAPGLNTAYRIELQGNDATHIIHNQAMDVVLNCRASLKSFLQGAYSSATNSMRADLSALGYLPQVQPYNISPWNYSGTETLNGFLPNIVDWVLIELRTGIQPFVVVDRKAAVLRTNGDITIPNGNMSPAFNKIIPGHSYQIVIYHRNHLPVMSANPVQLPNTLATRYDFTLNPSIQVYSTTLPAVIQLENGVYGQIAGDINQDNYLKYTGPDNDRGCIINKISDLYTPPPAASVSTLNGYYPEDLNLDGIVKYSGPGNDQSIIINNIYNLTGLQLLTTVYQGQVPISISEDNKMTCQTDSTSKTTRKSSSPQ